MSEGPGPERAATAAEAQQLAEAVKGLALSVRQLTARTSRSEKSIIGIAIALVIDVILTGAVVFTGYQVSVLADCQRHATQARDFAAVQSRNSARELWLAFLANAPAHPGERPSPEQRQRSIDALRNYLASLDAANRATQEYRCPGIWS